eukprot:5419749-Alexandrium_andersonii.AAC.1
MRRLLPAWEPGRAPGRPRPVNPDPRNNRPAWNPRRPENRQQPIPRDSREQSRQQKRNARDAATSTP